MMYQGVNVEGLEAYTTLNVILQLVRPNNRARGKKWFEDQCMYLGTSDSDSQYFTTAMIRSRIAPPYERRHHLLSIMSTFTDDDNSVELFTF